MAEIKQIQAGGINYDVSDVRLDYEMITNWNELFPTDSTRRRIYAYSNGGSGVSNTPYTANDNELFYGYSEGNNISSIQVVKTVWSSTDANKGRMFVRTLFNGSFTPWVEISGKVSGPSSATNNAVAIFDGTGGKTIKNSGFTIGKSVPSDAKFTDTTYSQISRGSSAGLAPGLPSGSGTTKYLREDGSWQVPPDTNTWRPVQDNLTSTSTTDCLSANQGKVLNDNISTYNLGEFSTLSALESSIVTYIGNISNDQFKNVKIAISSAFGLFKSTTYEGTITRFSSTRFHVNFYRGQVAEGDIVGSYNNGTWEWEQFALNSKITFVDQSASIQVSSVGFGYQVINHENIPSGYTVKQTVVAESNSANLVMLSVNTRANSTVVWWYSSTASASVNLTLRHLCMK